MKALVVYDSVFGNTEQIAQVIGNALEPEYHVDVLKVSNVKLKQLKDLNLLIIGSPTRKFRATGAISKFLRIYSKNFLQI